MTHTYESIKFAHNRGEKLPKDAFDQAIDGLAAAFEINNLAAVRANASFHLAKQFNLNAGLQRIRENAHTRAKAAAEKTGRRLARLLGWKAKHGHDREMKTGISEETFFNLPPGAAITLLFPDFFGVPSREEENEEVTRFGEALDAGLRNPEPVLSSLGSAVSGFCGEAGCPECYA